MTALKRGDYCCPSTEAEWKSILDLAEALGIGLESIDKSQWGRCSFVWYSDTATSEGICELNSRSGYVFYRRIEVPDFIAGMYAMKEDNGRLVRVNPDTQKAAADFYMSLEANRPKDAIKEAIEPMRQELLSANERITKLEGSPLWNVAHIVNGNWVFEKGTSDAVTAIVQPLTDRITKLDKRIRALEAEPIDMSECENVSQDDVDATRLSLCKRQYVNMTDHVDFVIQFDPKASPKNIPFSVALEYLKAGREVRRAHWRDGALKYDYANKWITGSPLLMVANTDMIAIPVYDILASDWEVIQETKKP